MDLSVLESDPRLFLYTSLTAGSSHIVTATSRIETILRANKIPFVAVDTATDERAKKLFQRRAQGRKLPVLVREGYILGDLEQIEEWNEFGELKENVDPMSNKAAVPEGAQVGVSTAPPLGSEVGRSLGAGKSTTVSGGTPAGCESKATEGKGVEGTKVAGVPLPGMTSKSGEESTTTRSEEAAKTESTDPALTKSCEAKSDTIAAEQSAAENPDTA